MEVAGLLVRPVVVVGRDSRGHRVKSEQEQSWVTMGQQLPRRGTTNATKSTNTQRGGAILNYMQLKSSLVWFFKVPHSFKILLISSVQFVLQLSVPYNPLKLLEAQGRAAHGGASCLLCQGSWLWGLSCCSV